MPPRRGRAGLLENWLIHGPGFLRRLAGALLTRQAVRADGISLPAAEALAWAVETGLDPALKDGVERCFQRITRQEAVDRLWQIWLDTQGEALFALLRLLPQPARRPPAARAISLLASSQPPQSIHAALIASDLSALLEAACGKHSYLVERSLAVIRLFEKKSWVEMVCTAWAQNRSPRLEQILLEKQWRAERSPAALVLTCLLINQVAPILNGPADVIKPLLAACEDPTPDIARRALACLPALQSQAAIAAFCQAWDSTRRPHLEKALLQARYLPSQPLELRLKAGFKNGQRGLIANLPPESVPAWLALASDPDETIRVNALAAAVELHEAAREEVCRLAVHADDRRATQVAAAHDFHPQSPSDQALLLFFQERWDDYSQFDFDSNLLETVYAAAPPALRKRIAERIRAAGRPEFLSILSGGDLHFRAAVSSLEEAETLTEILTAGRDFPALWRLLPSLPLRHVVTALNTLSAAGWRPGEASDQSVLEEWIQLARGLPADLHTLTSAIPWAAPCASLRVRGRINAVAFSPASPLLAIATGDRRLVLWDFSHARIDTVYTAFAHSLARTVFSPSGLFCAERTNVSAPCGIYRCAGGGVIRIGQHLGQVTALIPYQDERLISAGRDKRIALWSASPAPHEITSLTAPDWPRAALLSNPDTLLTFTDEIQAWEVPHLRPAALPSTLRQFPPDYLRSQIIAPAIAPDWQTCILGQSSGRVFAIPAPGATPSLLTSHPGAVKQTTFLNGGSSVLTAGAEGQIRVFTWPDRLLTARVDLPDGRLSTLEISPDGAFMAAGGSDAELTLWDLRMDQLHAILQQPLAVCTPGDLALLSALEINTAFSPDMHRLMHLAVLLLRTRFRFDVQIEEPPAIQPGEFDIIL